MSSLFPGREPAHSTDVAPVEEEDSGISWLAVGAAYLGTLFASDALGLSRTDGYALGVLLPAAVLSAFEIRKRSSSGRVEGGGEANSRRGQWLPAVVRGTAIAASMEVLGDAMKRDGITALGRPLAPAGASLDYATKCGWVFFVSVGVSKAARRALLRKLRQ